jgi:hypothetical protein
MNHKLTKLLLVSGLVIGSTAAIMTNQKVFSIPVQIKQAQANTANIVEDNDFRFKFNSCLRRGKTVSCSLLITNLDEDRKFEISSSTDNYRNLVSPRIIDSEGDEYLPEKVELGSSSASKPKRQYFAEIKLIQGIPTKATFHYDVPQSISKLAIVEVNYYLESEKRRSVAYKAEFRDVAITIGANTSTPQSPRKK